MNTYLCFYKSSKVEVKADSSYDAQKIATAHFQMTQRAKVKSYDVTVKPLLIAGKSVINSTIF
jgi:hypothetical protein